MTSEFFAFTVHFASNPLSEICYIHLNCTAVSRLCSVSEVTLIVTNCTMIVLILRDSVQHCAVRSTLDLVPIDVVPLAVIFL